MEHHEWSKQGEIDPFAIEELSIRNQSEWELWGAIVRDFGNRNLHMAYLSFLGRNLCFDRGAARYREHRRQFITAKADFWQAELADEMLEKIQELCLLQFERAGRGRPLAPREIIAARDLTPRLPRGLILALALVAIGALVSLL